ncbi:MAG: hypothetical protein ABJD02_08910 [Paraglaciecola sp.]|uniref:hypothetical protein n=1 Tax=Paraglaciecola sp. TaxID=1920173 RepID=UPI003266EF73
MKKILLSFCVLAISATASAENEKVTNVYTCGNDVGIYVENVGWLVALKSEVGEKRVDRILSIGLSLLATQAPIGYFNASESISWCGISNVRPIGVLQIKRP